MESSTTIRRILKAMSILNLMKLDTETTHDDVAEPAEDEAVGAAELTEDEPVEDETTVAAEDDVDFIEHAVIAADGDIMLDVDSDAVLTPARARLLGERLIQIADEIDPGASSVLDLLNEAEKRSMGLVNDLMERDAKIAELQVQFNEAVLDQQHAALRAHALEERLNELKTTSVWEVSFTGQRVYIAAQDMATALVRFAEHKPNVKPTAIKTAGVTLVV